MAIYSNSGFTTMSQDVKQLRVKIFDELSKIVDPEINTTITELELIDEVDISQESVKVDLHLTSPFCPAVFGFKICQDIHDNLLSIDGIDDVKVNVSNHFMAEQINNQVNNSPNPHKKESAADPNAPEPEPISKIIEPGKISPSAIIEATSFGYII